MGTSAVTGSHIAVALGHGNRHGQVAIFAVYVVGSRPGIVTEQDNEIFDLQRFLLSDLFNADNLAGSFLELPKLTQKVPKPRFGDNSVRSEDSHSVQRGLWLIFNWQFAANDTEFTKWSLHLLFYLEIQN